MGELTPRELSDGCDLKAAPKTCSFPGYAASLRAGILAPWLGYSDQPSWVKH